MWSTTIPYRDAFLKDNGERDCLGLGLELLSSPRFQLYLTLPYNLFVSMPLPVSSAVILILAMATRSSSKVDGNHEQGYPPSCSTESAKWPARSQSPDARITIKNRRKRYLDIHPEYFSSPSLELAGVPHTSM